MERSRHRRVRVAERTTVIVITGLGTLGLTADPWSEEARVERTTVTEDSPPTLYEYYASFIVRLSRLEGRGRFIFANQCRIEMPTDTYRLIF